MKVMTFNIRNAIADDGENSWKYRKDAVFDYLSKSNAEIICMQEVVPEVKKEMQAFLSDKYSFVGKGRLAEPREDDEINLVAYKKNKLDLKNSSHFWLSDTPQVAGSRYPTQKFWPRTCTAADFCGAAGAFSLFATHLDNADPAAREKGLALILGRAANKEKVLLCGDFNEEPETVLQWMPKEYTDLSGGLIDTFHGYGEGRGKIDYIFGKGGFRAEKIVCDKTMRSGGFLSDHYPVWAEII